VSPDDIRRAVLEREDVARYLDPQATSIPDARERIEGFLEELRTTQRYRFYRALQHPLYPILRKVRRIAEHVEFAREAVGRGRVVYVSNHKSHLDYLVQPLVLDDNGVRPPVIVAGINLFGGAFGLIHRHVTGALPLRRNSKDPLYLVTLRAYVAELLKRRDLLYYAEGGRSYSGELKSFKTGLFQAALAADRADLMIVPTAVAYDITLEDRMISREAIRKRARPFSKELAEMARHAVGYKSRAFVTFGEPIPLSNVDPDSRRDLVTLVHRVHGDIGRLYKVLPTALVAATCRPHMSLADLRDRLDETIAGLAARGANLAVRTGTQAIEDGLSRLEERRVLVVERQHVRVRNRIVLRYYARTIQHLLAAGRTTH
jgi:glycerol-3-phosphate O-acyltransferase